jgi:hypothetical protein
MQSQLNDPLLTTNQVRALAGSVSTMCLWRWQRDDGVRFPPPDAQINGRNYWRGSTIKSWQDRMAAQMMPHVRKRFSADVATAA